MFIKVTDSKEGGELFININHIEDFTKGAEENVVFIAASNYSYMVVGTLEEIYNKIQDVLPSKAKCKWD